MSRETLGPFFDRKVRVEYDAGDGTSLARTVGVEGIVLASANLVCDPGGFQVFGQAVTARLGANVWVGIHPHGQSVPGIAVGESFTSPAGMSFAELTIDSELDAAGTLSRPAVGALQLSANASARGKLGYRHLLCVAATDRRRSALERLALSSQIPFCVDLARPTQGEVSSLAATFELDLGLEAKLGRGLAFAPVVAAFGAASPLLQAHVEATLKASLGLSIYERMVVSVGSACLRNPGWMRIRLQRESQRRLTLGVVFAIQASYDLGSGLTAILEHALGLTPLPRLMSAVREVDALAEKIVAGKWDEVKDTLTADAQDVLTEYLDDASWLSWAADSPEVGQLVKLSQELVSAYDGLDPRVQSLWDRLLGKVDLDSGSKARAVLKTIADIDPDTVRFEDFVGSESLRQANELIEALSGEAVESLLLSQGSEARRALASAVSSANQAIGFLQSAPAALLTRIHDFGRRTGIEAVVAWLKVNATSAVALQKAAMTRISRAVIGALSDKVWNSITDQDVAKIRDFATQLDELLKPAIGLEAKLKDDLAALKAQFGCSLALEVGRVATATALIDLELDPSDRTTIGRAARYLRTGNVQGVLESLPVASRNPDASTAPLSYMLRECAFTSSLIRSSLLTEVLSLFTQQRKTERISEVTLHVTQASAGEPAVREARYSGGLRRTEASGGLKSIAGVFLDLVAAGSGNDIDRAFDVVQSQVRLAWCYEEVRPTDAEVDAFDPMLAALGLVNPEATVKALVRGQDTVRLALELRLPCEAALAILSASLDDQRWDADYLAAARRWYDEPLITKAEPNYPKIRLGRAIARLTANNLFLKNWQLGIPDFEAAARQAGKVQFPVDKTTVRLDYLVDRSGSGMRWYAPYMSLRNVIQGRGQGLWSAGAAAGAYAAALRSKSPADLGDLCIAFADAEDTCFPDNWPNSMFDFWLTLARVRTLAPASLTAAKGLATVRTRAGTVWSEPVVWALKAGIPDQPLGPE